MAARVGWPILFALLLAIGWFSPTFAALTATVKAGGNIRSEARIAPATVLGQVCPGDQVIVLETKVISKATWYRVMVTSLTTGSCKAAKHVAVDTEGWVSNTLLTKPVESDGAPAQPVAPQPTPVPTQAAQKCDPSYPDLCIPPNSPDLDCADIPQRNFRVVGADPHRFDQDHDGIGCEKK